MNKKEVESEYEQFKGNILAAGLLCGHTEQQVNSLFGSGDGNLPVPDKESIKPEEYYLVEDLHPQVEYKIVYITGEGSDEEGEFKYPCHILERNDNTGERNAQSSILIPLIYPKKLALFRSDPLVSTEGKSIVAKIVQDSEFHKVIYEGLNSKVIDAVDLAFDIQRELSKGTAAATVVHPHTTQIPQATVVHDKGFPQATVVSYQGFPQATATAALPVASLLLDNIQNPAPEYLVKIRVDDVVRKKIMERITMTLENPSYVDRVQLEAYAQQEARRHVEYQEDGKVNALVKKVINDDLIRWGKGMIVKAFRKSGESSTPQQKADDTAQLEHKNSVILYGGGGGQTRKNKTKKNKTKKNKKRKTQRRKTQRRKTNKTRKNKKIKSRRSRRSRRLRS